jgi:hypothetical protein
MAKEDSSREIFQNLRFIDVFETFDEKYLVKMASTNFSQLQKMCIYLTLDTQLEKEQIIDKKDLN